MAKAMTFEILSFPINIAKVSHNRKVTKGVFFLMKFHAWTRYAPEYSHYNRALNDRSHFGLK